MPDLIHEPQQRLGSCLLDTHRTLSRLISVLLDSLFVSPVAHLTQMRHWRFSKIFSDKNSFVLFRELLYKTQRRQHFITILSSSALIYL